jgi:hypothetical protein
MEPGLYEQLVTEILQNRLLSDENAGSEIRPVDVADQPHVLARHVGSALERALSATRDPNGGSP